MKFPGYFLIVADFINWAKAQRHPRRPGPRLGRGLARRLRADHHRPRSAALRPAVRALPQPRARLDAGLRRRLLPGAARRGHPLRAASATAQDRVAQIITFGTLQARGVLRDVGRVLRCPTARSTSSPSWCRRTRPSRSRWPRPSRASPSCRRPPTRTRSSRSCSTSPQKLEGLYRHASTHAAGIVIGDRPLEELVPLYRDPKSDMPVTQFNMKWVEPAGLVKFDFLGLKTLTVLKTRRRPAGKPRHRRRPLGHPARRQARPSRCSGAARRSAVFQVECAGMRKALAEMRADRFEDIIALVALYRPGPMANIPVYCAAQARRGAAPTICTPSSSRC